MSIINILLISLNLISLIKLQEFEESQIDCPRHFSKVTCLNYINSTATYISADDSNGLRLNDIRTGDLIYKYDGIYFFDNSGIISVTSSSDGDVLAITRSELFYFNIFQNNMIAHSIQNQQLVAQSQFFVKTQWITQMNLNSSQIQQYMIFIQVNLDQGLTQLYYIQNQTLSLFYEVTNGVNTNVPNAQLNQAQNFVIAQNVTGMSGFAQPVNILVGISQNNFVFATFIPNINIVQATQNNMWIAYQSDYIIISFNHLSGSSILAVQYGASIKRPVNNTYTNCLVFYDLQNLQLDKSKNYFQTDKMLKQIIASIQMGNNTISLIYNFWFGNSYYTTFATNNKTLIIQKTQDLISSKFQLLNSPIQIVFDDNITSIEYTDIYQSQYLLLGFGSGSVSKFNFQNYLSSNSTKLQAISNVNLNFTQKYLGMKSLVNSSFFDSSNGILSVISNKNNQLKQFSSLETVIVYLEFSYVFYKSIQVSVYEQNLNQQRRY
ncbi:hypothetical protein TTHERM_00654190 (macronuclear) [Tetrahymena thermophila SB210]|uniref:Transmembrane protein n=1 Tax=Tetrahymena thermophila (strain SB210) TaxID=312017 RepID=Q23AV8_TETTS|nr:hypothetical protein TTHERM_00654190 [Tetrahymena thermophila SB210]EAR93726.2 hypothetical protein TTHERM_00654190 [Tetrahymena thermophila SB210]|eukprot:XP_001013971.2 hypothetical protein TTHERM_00654190 [Tetrahymena thermophila SB210]